MSVGGEFTRLNNPSNACFINGITQVLALISGIEDEINPDVGRVIKQLKSSKQDVIDPNYGHITVDVQQDSEEILKKNIFQNKDDFKQLGMNVDIVTTNKKSTQKQSMIDLINVSETGTVQYSLAKFITDDGITKKIINYAPSYLILVLHDANPKSLKTFIINEEVDLPINYHFNTLGKRVLYDRHQNAYDIRYDLIGVVMYTGTGKSGHYIAIKKVKDNWYIFNDYRLIGPFSKFDDAKSNVNSFIPRILLYERSDNQGSPTIDFNLQIQNINKPKLTKIEIESLVNSGAYWQCYNLVTLALQNFEQKQIFINTANTKAEIYLDAIKCLIFDNIREWKQLISIKKADDMKVFVNEYKQKFMDNLVENGGLKNKKNINILTKNEIEGLVNSGAYWQCYNLIELALQNFDHKQIFINTANDKAEIYIEAIKCLIFDDVDFWKILVNIKKADEMRIFVINYKQTFINKLESKGGLQ